MSNKKLRIAFDASPLLVNKTGVAFYTERLIQQMAAAYPDVEFVGFYYNFLGKRSTKHFPQADNITFIASRFIPSKVIYQLRRWNIEIPFELLCPTRVDFILFTNFIGYPRLRKTPAATVVHDLTFVDIPEYTSKKNGSDLRRFTPKEIARSKFVVTVSNFSKQRIVEEYGVNPETILVTPIPPEPAQVYDQQTKDELIQKVGITKPFILFLSTIEPRKNILNLIAAHQELPPELQEEYTLVIAGRIGWNCEAEVAKLAEVQEQGLNIKHLGYVDDRTREALLQSATIMANASHYEGFGMTLLEAMRYGTPCVISDIPVYHDVAGESAVYFNQKDPADIAQKIAALLQNPEELQKKRVAAKAQADSFSWKTVAASLHDKIVQALRTT